MANLFTFDKKWNNLDLIPFVPFNPPEENLTNSHGLKQPISILGCGIISKLNNPAAKFIGTV